MKCLCPLTLTCGHRRGLARKPGAGDAPAHVQRGFTMVELVMVMIITGVLAIAIVPRLLDKDQFAARGAHDFVASALRYAQKAAITTRRNVCVGLSGSTITASTAPNPGIGGDCTGASITPLNNPTNELSYADASNALPGGATVSATTNLAFDAQGRPLELISAPSTRAPITAAITISINGYASPITIEPETGLIH